MRDLSKVPWEEVDVFEMWPVHSNPRGDSDDQVRRPQRPDSYAIVAHRGEAADGQVCQAAIRHMVCARKTKKAAASAVAMLTAALEIWRENAR